jgi:hypothetical protein
MICCLALIETGGSVCVGSLREGALALFAGPHSSPGRPLNEVPSLVVM